MASRVMFVLACAIAAAIPFAHAATTPAAPAPFPGWPPTFEGAALLERPLTGNEAEFEREFPGRIGRFQCGDREVIVRFLAEPTRNLHPSSDCYRFSGFEVAPLASVRDADGNLWGRFEARRGAERVVVRERIAGDLGESWSDVSQWYWAALLGSSRGPWWAWTCTEP